MQLHKKYLVFNKEVYSVHTEKTRRISDRKNVKYKNGFRGVHIENARVLTFKFLQRK